VTENKKKLPLYDSYIEESLKLNELERKNKKIIRAKAKNISEKKLSLYESCTERSFLNEVLSIW
tara:strand:+ start:4632 stop:4823 length:192 start_codon:yes stop_codon:yes gene_type:complete